MPHPHRARPLESEPAMVPLRSLTAERRNACCGEAVCPRETIERLLFDPDPVPLVEAVRATARLLARSFVFEEAELNRRFSQTFELPPECVLAEEFSREYRRERAVLESAKLAHRCALGIT